MREIDLAAAVDAGVISTETADALRAFAGDGGDTRAADAYPPGAADEENFKLLASFNDIFVTIASVLVFVGVVFTFGRVSALFLAATAWGLAEFFTHRRRMALPSILYSVVFVYGSGVALFQLAGGSIDVLAFMVPGTQGLNGSVTQSHIIFSELMTIMLGAAAAVAAAYAFWRRFHVPIAIANGASAVAWGAIALLMGIFPPLATHFQIVWFIVGLAMFGFAMRWDMTDTLRKTHRADVAFWLHMGASPLIVHSIFSGIGAFGSEPSPAVAGIVLAVYILLGAIALIVDRRALLVSALIYVVIAVAVLIKYFGSLQENFALIMIFIGGTLLLLSAFWQNLRAPLLRLLPAAWQAKLPPIHKFKASLPPVSA